VAINAAHAYEVRYTSLELCERAVVSLHTSDDPISFAESSDDLLSLDLLRRAVTTIRVAVRVGNDFAQRHPQRGEGCPETDV
jgi:hypothetical protein